MIENNYPGLSERIKSITVDGIMILIFIFLISFIFNQFEYVYDDLRIVAFIFVFFLYDPIFTSFLGGTIGHMIIGIRVKKEIDESKNINFFAALVRFAFKSALGILSLLTIKKSTKNKAIHDHMAKSVVIYKK